MECELSKEARECECRCVAFFFAVGYRGTAKERHVSWPVKPCRQHAASGYVCKGIGSYKRYMARTRSYDS
jgi:hypothetical protein